MRNIAALLTVVLFSFFANAQANPKNTLPTHRADSVDFRDASKPDSILLNDSRTAKPRKDSLQTDDKDPKKPKQKIQMK